MELLRTVEAEQEQMVHLIMEVLQVVRVVHILLKISEVLNLVVMVGYI